MSLQWSGAACALRLATERGGRLPQDTIQSPKEPAAFRPFKEYKVIANLVGIQSGGGKWRLHRLLASNRGATMHWVYRITVCCRVVDNLHARLSTTLLGGRHPAHGTGWAALVTGVLRLDRAPRRLCVSSWPFAWVPLQHANSQRLMVSVWRHYIWLAEVYCDNQHRHVPRLQSAFVTSLHSLWRYFKRQWQHTPAMMQMGRWPGYPGRWPGWCTKPPSGIK